MRQLLMPFWQNQQGQGLAEYSLILGLVSIAGVVALTTLGGEAASTLTHVTQLLP